MSSCSLPSCCSPSIVSEPGCGSPPFLISALPGIFVLVDVSGLFSNEDPQNHWRPVISLLHHATKPLAAVWLLGALTLLSLKLTAPVWLSNHDHALWPAKAAKGGVALGVAPPGSGLLELFMT